MYYRTFMEDIEMVKQTVFIRAEKHQQQLVYQQYSNNEYSRKVSVSVASLKSAVSYYGDDYCSIKTCNGDICYKTHEESRGDIDYHRRKIQEYQKRAYLFYFVHHCTVMRKFLSLYFAVARQFFVICHSSFLYIVFYQPSLSLSSVWTITVFSISLNPSAAAESGTPSGSLIPSAAVLSRPLRFFFSTMLHIIMVTIMNTAAAIAAMIISFFVKAFTSLHMQP